MKLFAIAKPKPKLPLDVRRHFLKRLRERYEIELTMRECKDLEKRRTGYFLHRETLTRQWYLMRINEQWIYCLYQKKLGFTTVLTPQQFWRSHPCLRLPLFRADSKFADAWIVADADREKYQSKKRRSYSGHRLSPSEGPRVATNL
jgi:hypothetical protein